MFPSRFCRFILPLLVGFGLLCLGTTPLLAHHLPPGMEDVDEFEDDAAFMAGTRHVLLGSDHWLAALAVGAVAALGATRTAKVTPAACFLIGIAGGAALGLRGVILNASFALLVTGLLAALNWPNARSRLSALKLAAVTMLALWQGNEHGVAWPLDTDTGWYVTGMLCMTVALVGCGAGLTKMALGMIRPPHPVGVTTH